MRLGDLDALKEEIDTWGCNDYDKYDFIEAIDNAPTVVENGLIAKDYILEKMFFVRRESDNQLIAVIPVGDLIAFERPQGEWIEVEDTETKINGYCSNCGWQSKLYEEDILGMPFCPNCGAKMKGGAK